MTHRNVLLILAGALLTYLGLSAALDPSLPFLVPHPGQTWWADPEPLAAAGVGGPFTRVYLFTPAADGSAPPSAADVALSGAERPQPLTAATKAATAAVM